MSARTHRITVVYVAWRTALDRRLGVADVGRAGLNWKGASIERVRALRAVAAGVYVGWRNRFDRRLGVADVDAAGLNWKGASIERLRAVRAAAVGPFVLLSRWAWRRVEAFLRLLALVASTGRTWNRRFVEFATGVTRNLRPWRADQFDRLLGTSQVHASGLNWKGRQLERLLALSRLPGRIASGLLAVALPVQNGALNWKGRMIERLRALRQVPARASIALGELTVREIDTICFAAYRLRRRLRRRDRVRSVLQFSIISHKPFMVSRALRAAGVKAEFFAINVSDDAILNVGWDYALPANIEPRKRRILESYYLWTVLARYDVIHSHFKTLLSHTGWEFEYLKRLGTVVVFNYRGCDVRYRSLNMRVQPDLNCCQECDYPVGSCDTDYQHSQVALTGKYGDAFLVTTPDLKPFSPRPAEHMPFMMPTGIDFESVAAADKPHGVFRVVTSSNHHGIDGTAYIRAAVERLRNEGWTIELVEVSKLRYREALAIYKSADVYAGKLRMGYYNNANIETMMLGVPNMSYIRPDFAAGVPDCPIINTTPDTIYDRLRWYLERPEELRAIGARGPAFVRAHHDPQQIARRLIDLYNAELSRQTATARFAMMRPAGAIGNGAPPDCPEA